jgi:hypothetical protein
MTKPIIFVLISAALFGCNSDNSTTGNLATSNVPAGVQQLEITNRADAYGGAVPAGAQGVYEVISGIVHGTLDPQDPKNTDIVDIEFAPLNEQGLVEYSTDFTILRPKDVSDARRVMFYDVVNRGSKIAQFFLIGGGALEGGAAPNGNIPSILERGHTVVWSGWQGGLTQSGNSTNAALGTSFPTAEISNTEPITEVVREEYIQDFSGGTANSIVLTYPPASVFDRSEVKFTARGSWTNAQGQQDYDVPSSVVSTWNYTVRPDGVVTVNFTPPANIPDGSGGSVPPDQGTIYQFVYRAKDPIVNGIGFAAVRDLIDFLKNKEADLEGNPNPLVDMRQAECARGIDCPTTNTTNYDTAIAFGLSQSGRFLRDFLYQGFNESVEGRKVFDGLIPVIPAARMTWTNFRFSQIGRWSKQHEDHFMPGDQFPFAYNVINDPVSGRNDGLMKKCAANETCPKIMQIDGSYEWWGGRASLVVTDGVGNDLTLPPNVRYYLISGTGHGGGGGATSGISTIPAANSMCQMPSNPAATSAVVRAMVQKMEEWVIQDTPPPPSSYPTVAAGNLVEPTSVMFPNLDSIIIPSGSGAAATAYSLSFMAKFNQLFQIDYSRAEPIVDLSKEYAVLVPQVDSNGNETSGIAAPDISVPLGTYTGWNPRGDNHSRDNLCAGAGGYVPFAIDDASKAGGNDLRNSLENLYSGRADYQSKVAAAADDLVASGYLLQVDADNVYKSNSTQISPLLIQNP